MDEILEGGGVLLEIGDVKITILHHDIGNDKGHFNDSYPVIELEYMDAEEKVQSKIIALPIEAKGSAFGTSAVAGTPKHTNKAEYGGEGGKDRSTLCSGHHAGGVHRACGRPGHLP